MSSNSRLGLVRVEGVEGAVHQHVSENEILEDLDTLWRSSFIVALERFEEVDLRLGPILCSTKRSGKLQSGEEAHDSLSDMYILPPHSRMMPWILG